MPRRTQSLPQSSQTSGTPSSVETPPKPKRKSRAKTAPTPKQAKPKRKTKGAYVCDWIEKHCVLTSAEWIGKPFVLQAWQRRLIYGLFEIDPGTGYRMKRWAYIQIAKKNGKTELAAALACYFLLGDGEPAPLVVCGASSDEQADLVFSAAKTICTLSPTLSQVTQCFDKEITVPSQPGARLRRVSSNAPSLDGLNVHAAILDELHEWQGRKGENLWNVLTNGTGARRQPMIVQITTAGWDQTTICYRQYEWAKRVLAKPELDPAYFAYIAEAPPGCDLLADESIAAANPNYGVTVFRPFFEDQENKKSEATYRRYFLNQWTDSEEIWEAAAWWGGLASTTDELDRALPVCVGIDVALRGDSSAVVVAQKQAEKVVVRAKIWQNPYPATHAQHTTWKLNTAEVEAYLLDLYATYKAPAREVDGELRPGPGFFYDPNFFDRSAQLLEDEGLTMVEYPQMDVRMIAAAQNLYDLIRTGVISHDGDPDFEQHIRNVIADQRPRGWRMSKPKGSRKKIDAAIACAIACYEATRVMEEEGESVYEERDLLTL